MCQTTWQINPAGFSLQRTYVPCSCNCENKIVLTWLNFTSVMMCSCCVCVQAHLVIMNIHKRPGCSQAFTASYASLSRQNEMHRVAKFSLRFILNIFTNCSAWCTAMAYYVNGKAVWIQRSDWDTTRYLKMQLTHLPWPKWPPFHRRYFQMHFREWNDFLIWLKFHFSLFLRAQFTLSQH